MSATIPENMRDLLTREKKAFAFLALPMSDGTPHETIVWFDWDGTYIIINTARGRVKDKLLHKHPRVALVIAEPDNFYRYLQIRGPVVEETEEGAYDVICSLNEKYHGKYEFPKRPGQVRVTYKILPANVTPYDE
jgi:PPOX class probable F420-dependent enzyme